MGILRSTCPECGSVMERGAMKLHRELRHGVK